MRAPPLDLHSGVEISLSSRYGVEPYLRNRRHAARVTSQDLSQATSVSTLLGRHKGWLLLGLVASVAVSAGLVRFWANTNLSSTVGALGAVFSIWGLAISIAGFGLTWWQLSRTQRAASAVAAAVARLKRDFGAFDVITELRTAQASAQETQGHIDGMRWELAIAGYNKTRASLMKMVAVRDGLSGARAEAAKDFIGEGLDACQNIEGLSTSSPQSIPRQALNMRLRELDNFLISVEFELKDAIRGNE